MNIRLSARLLVASALAAILVAGGGCQKADETPSIERVMETPAVPSVVTSSPDLTGIWTVVGHRIPGVSAMSDAEATAWHGLTVRLETLRAISAGNRCDHPTYTTNKVERDGFLATEFNLPPGSLAPLASLERLTLIEVSCNDAPWAALGGRLIEIDANNVLAPWDGIFFELARDHDFRAAGQEPFWHLDIQKGKDIRFMQVSKTEVVTPMPMPKIDLKTGTKVYHAVTEANDLRVVIEPTSCTDVMSGKPFEATVTVTLYGQTYHGCGEALQ